MTSEDGSTQTLSLAPQVPGAFANDVVATTGGVWRARVRARGWTRAGRPFTREQLLSAAILEGGDRTPPPASADPRDALACLLRCLASDSGGKRWLDEHRIEAEKLIECLRRCRGDAKELERLG